MIKVFLRCRPNLSTYTVSAGDYCTAVLIYRKVAEKFPPLCNPIKARRFMISISNNVQCWVARVKKKSYIFLYIYIYFLRLHYYSSFASPIMLSPHINYHTSIWLINMNMKGRKGRGSHSTRLERESKREIWFLFNN